MHCYCTCMFVACMSYSYFERAPAHTQGPEEEAHHRQSPPTQFHGFHTWSFICAARTHTHAHTHTHTHTGPRGGRPCSPPPPRVCRPQAAAHGAGPHGSAVAWGHTECKVHYTCTHISYAPCTVLSSAGPACLVAHPHTSPPSRTRLIAVLAASRLLVEK